MEEMERIQEQTKSINNELQKINSNVLDVIGKLRDKQQVINNQAVVIEILRGNSEWKDKRIAELETILNRAGLKI